MQEGHITLDEPFASEEDGPSELPPNHSGEGTMVVAEVGNGQRIHQYE